MYSIIQLASKQNTFKARLMEVLMGKLIDLTGQKFGRLTVLYRSKNPKYKIPYWTCKCDCGNIVNVRSQSLRSGETKSCGCYKLDLFKTNPKEHIINKIKDKAKWMLDYFEEYEVDSIKEYGIYSNKKVFPTCPICKTKSNHEVSIGTIYKNNGFGCRICGYGKQSIGQRVMFAILAQANINFDTEVKIDNSYQRYDFYIPDYKVAIEIDGTLGHGRKGFRGSKHEIEKSKALDIRKDTVSKLNGIKVIRINTDSDFDNVYNAIINPELKEIINFNNIDKDYVLEYTFRNSIFLNILNDFNSEQYTVDELSKKYKFHKATIMRYLRIGEEYGMCSYKKRKRLVMVRCVNNGMVFNSAKEACEWCGIKNNRICRCCEGKIKSCGKHPETGERLMWEFV